jgi:shikimate kinase
MKTRGTVIYLRCSPNELYLRTRYDRNRPLLQTEDPLAKLKSLYEARHPLYLETADLVLDTGRQSVHCLATRLEQLLADAGVPSVDAPRELPAECAEPQPTDAAGDPQG